MMPDNFDLLLKYPPSIQERVALKLAEVALRGIGDLDHPAILPTARAGHRRFARPAADARCASVHPPPGHTQGTPP